MQSNTFNPKISKEITEKFASIIDIIDDTPNTIPSVFKRSFNFKGRKSDLIASKVIRHLTNSTSKICDPFFGSGSFVIASLMANRDITGIELDNYTYSVVNSLLSEVDLVKLENLFTLIKNEVFDQTMYLYETSCCEHKNYIKTLFFDPETSEFFSPETHRDIKNGHNIKMYYKCPICGNSTKSFEIQDMQKIEEVNALDTSQFPNHELIENSRINITASTGADKYDRNYVNRSKRALLLLQEAISSLDESNEKNVLQHALISSLTLGRIAQYGSSSDILYHVVRSKAQEMNIWYLFSSKYNNMIKYIKHISELNQSNDLTLINDDYNNILSQDCYSETFDLIYTDPPYTDQVPYLERNQLYRDWLKKFVSEEQFKLTDEMLNNEIVVSNSPIRTSKDLDNYFRDIDVMFSVFSKAIKVNGYVALTLNLGKQKFFKTLSTFINAARKNGFEYISRVNLEKNDPTLRKQSAWSDTLSKEMLIFFIKLDDENSYWYYDNQNIELKIARHIYNLILNNSNGITVTRAYKEICKEVLNKPVESLTDYEKNKIKTLLNQQFIIDTRTAMVFINPDKLYIDIEDDTTLFNKLYDIVPIIVNKLLDEKDSFVLEDIYYEISSKICNGNPHVLAQILKDENRVHHIRNLINNYCDLDQKNVYIRKAKNTTLSDNAIDISVLEGYEFENILKELLEAEGFTDVLRNGGAGDRGIDLKAKRRNDATGKLEGYIFQAKRWIGNVGSEPIQRLHSMMMQYQSEIHHAICITTSDYTRHGVLEAESTGVQIINGEQLMTRLDNVFPGKYYHGLLNFDV